MFLYVYITLYIYIDSIIDCNYMYVCAVCIYVRKSSLPRSKIFLGLYIMSFQYETGGFYSSQYI